MLDLEGVLWCDWPVANESLGRSFAYRDYFHRHHSASGIRTSLRYSSAKAEPRPMVIAISNAIRNAEGHVVGILVLQQPP